MPESILDWGIELIRYLQASFSGTLGFMELVTLLGHENFYFFVLPVFLWAVDYQYGIRLAVFIGITNTLNQFFKVGFDDPRPYWYDTRVEMLAPPETGFGLPSGHAQNAVVVWGVLAQYVRQRWFTVLAVALMLLIGLSRIFLAAHFPTDVIAGWLLGFLVLFGVPRLEKKFSPVINKLSTSAKIRYLFLATIAAILVFAGLGKIFREASLPLEAWVANAASQGIEADHLPAPYSLDGIIATVASIFGIVAGSLMLVGRAGYVAKGALWKKVVRVVIGLAGVLVFQSGLDVPFEMIAPVEGTLAALILRYIRYGLVGLWIGWLAPMVFIKLKLAQPATS